MQRDIDETEAERLRGLVKEVSNAVEARIRGEVAAGEQVRKATQKLQIAGMGPPEYWGSQLWQPLKNVCLIMAQEMKLLPCINQQKDSISAEAIAKDTGNDALLVARILRVLANVGICEETGPNMYKRNELSQIAASLGGMAGVKISNELLFPIASKIVPYMRDSGGFKQFPRRPQEMDVTQYTYGGKMMWEYFKDNPETKQWFDTLMAENRANNTPWFWIYPIADELHDSCEPDDVLLVDVGGNRGADIIELQQNHPELRGRLILQDLPETIDAIDRSDVPDSIELQAYDFFKPQPVTGAKAYFFRWILHDWDDDNIRKFLGNTVRAMDSESKLLLEEFVLPDEGVDMKGSHLDILMMLYHSGMERSLSQWTTLLNSCGLEITKIWSRPDTDPKVIECRLQKP